MKKTALTKLLAYIRAYHSREPELIEYAETLIEDEREQIVSAWVRGNAEGWAMTTDWPESGERYYEEKIQCEKMNWLSELYLSGKAVCGVCANKKGVGRLSRVNGTHIMCICEQCKIHKFKQHGWKFEELTASKYSDILNENKKNPHLNPLNPTTCHPAEK